VTYEKLMETIEMKKRNINNAQSIIDEITTEKEVQ
jgi:hypothetical protein